MLKIAFWGLGSIAKRHIKNINSVLIEDNYEFEIDVFRHEYKEVEDSECKNIIKHVYVEDDIEDKQYDIIFITNPTALHYEAIRKCVLHTKHMFIEKPVFDKDDINYNNLNLKEDGVYYVACPLRYSSVLQYVKENIDLSNVYSVRAMSSSYLPDWRPLQDYRETYSAHKDMGGGVAIDLIHEWDYLTYLFGFPQNVHYVGGKYSHLEIDSDDLATYIGEYDNKVVELHLDYFGRKTLRELQLFTKEDTIIADLTNRKISFLKENYTVELQEDRNKYQKKEIRHFLDIINGKCDNDNSIQNAVKVLKLTNNKN